MTLEQRPLLRQRRQEGNVVARHRGKGLRKVCNATLDPSGVSIEVDWFRTDQHLERSRLRVQELSSASQNLFLRGFICVRQRRVRGKDVQNSHAVPVPTATKSRDAGFD
jgi:hypothetical protein